MFSVRNTQKLVEIYNNRLLQSTKLVKNEKMIQKKDKFFFGLCRTRKWELKKRKNHTNFVSLN